MPADDLNAVGSTAAAQIKDVLGTGASLPGLPRLDKQPVHDARPSAPRAS